MHIELDDAVVSEIDAIAGTRGRSEYVRAALARALESDRRLKALLSVAGAIKDTPHEWDDDPAAWVRAQRRTDPRRVG
jgi:Arc/MetJ family transcription regulator